MKSETLTTRYLKFKVGNDTTGNYLILSKAIRGMKYNKWDVYKAFNKYVPKDDYAAEEKEMLMDNLVLVTNADSPSVLPLNKATSKIESAQVKE